MLLELADLIDLAGELPFKSSAYRKVAQSLNCLDEPLEALARENRLNEISGAGKAIVEKLETMVGAGKLPSLEKWRRHEISVFYPALSRLNLEPRPLGNIIRKLKARDFEDLKAKLEANGLKKLTGRAKETAQKILNNN